MGRLDNLHRLLGSFSGDGGAAQDDSIKASLDLAHTDLDTILAAAPRVVSKAGIALDGDTIEDVFLVAGGPVLIVSMLLILTEAVSAHNTLMGWVSDPTAGTGPTDIAAEGVDLVSAAIGDIFYAELDATTPVKAEPGTALPLAGAAGVCSGIVVPVGGIDFTFDNDTITSGIGTMHIRYLPLASGAAIVAGS